jgi:hypothetical protein
LNTGSAYAQNQPARSAAQLGIHQELPRVILAVAATPLRM